MRTTVLPTSRNVSPECSGRSPSKIRLETSPRSSEIPEHETADDDQQIPGERDGEPLGQHSDESEHRATDRTRMVAIDAARARVDEDIEGGVFLAGDRDTVGMIGIGHRQPDQRQITAADPVDAISCPLADAFERCDMTKLRDKP